MWKIRLICKVQNVWGLSELTFSPKCLLLFKFYSVFDCFLYYVTHRPTHLPVPISYKCIMEVVDKLVIRFTDVVIAVFGSSVCLIGPRAQNQFSEDQYRHNLLDGLCEMATILISSIYQIARYFEPLFTPTKLNPEHKWINMCYLFRNCENHFSLIALIQKRLFNQIAC